MIHARREFLRLTSAAAFGSVLGVRPRPSFALDYPTRSVRVIVLSRRAVPPMFSQGFWRSSSPSK